MDGKINSRFINRFITSFIISKKTYINKRKFFKGVEVFYYEIFNSYNKFVNNEYFGVF